MAVGIVLLVAAMLRYPGGTVFDVQSTGHSFWFNFLCDLTSDVAVNGRFNPGAGLASAAMIAFCVALAFFWVVLPSSYRDHRGLSTATRTLGIVSALGLAVVPVATGFAHMVAVFASSIPAVCAGVLGLIGTFKILRSRVLGLLAAATVAVSALDAALYAHSYMVHPRVILHALPLFQRVAMLLMLTWMAAVAVGNLRHALYSGTKR